MSTRVRRKVALATLLVCVLPAAPAVAQKGAPFSHTKLSSHPKGVHAKATATPTATATATPEATATATAAPRRHHPLPNTGADPMRLALAGLTLLGFGLSLRFRVALADARRPD